MYWVASDINVLRKRRPAARGSSCRRSWPRCPPTARSPTFDQALAHVAGPETTGRAPKSSGSRRCWTCCSSIRSSRSSRILDRADAGAPRSADADGAAVRAARRRRARVRLPRQSGRWCASTRAGVRPRAASSASASSTCSTASITCCFSRASSSRSGASGRSSPSSLVRGGALGHAHRSAFGFVPAALWFPPLIETLIAVSIALHGVREHRWASRRSGGGWWRSSSGSCTASAFSFALRETLQFAGGHLLTSLLAFNVGVELGQLLVVVGAGRRSLSLLFRLVVAAARRRRSCCRRWSRTRRGTGCSSAAASCGCTTSARRCRRSTRRSRRRDALGHADADGRGAGLADVDGVSEDGTVAGSGPVRACAVHRRHEVTRGHSARMAHAA